MTAASELQSVVETGEVTIEVIPLHRLFIDDRFQRPLDEKRVTRYLNSYDQKMVEPLTVNRRQYDRFSVIDGQHRLALLRMLSKTEWPCVVHSISAREEAKLFVDLQAQLMRIHP